MADVTPTLNPTVAGATPALPVAEATPAQTASLSNEVPFSLNSEYSTTSQILTALGITGATALILYFFRKNLTIDIPITDATGEVVPVDGSSEEGDEENELGGSMTFLEHLTELRIRLIRCVIALSLGVVLCFIFSDKLVYLLRNCVPEDNVRLVTLHPIEAFLTILKISAVGGLFIAFPVIFYEIWMFVAPGLYKRERRFVLPLAIAAWICFILGAVFCYFVVFRFTLAFFASMAGNTAENMWGLSNYLSFMIRFLLAFAIVFEEPVVILLLAKVGLVNRKMLSDFRPYAIIVMFVLAAVITPPDPISQMMCAAPLLILYEVSILIVRFIEKEQVEASA